MDNAAWIAEVKRRVAIDEGDEAKMCHDTKGVPTIGVGFNLRRADARTALERVGVPASDGFGPDAHAKFVQAANHMRTLPWYRQTGDRSKRDCAMMQVGDWCNPSGNGSDILPA
jgi:hypothetical protein